MNSAQIDGMISNIALYVRKIREVAERSSVHLVIVQLLDEQCRRYKLPIIRSNLGNSVFFVKRGLCNIK